MSDIPRTDTSIYFTEHSQMYDIASEMKKLERELYAANERIKLLEAANSDVHRIANERNAANHRIKQLEDIINRASIRFFKDGSDGKTATQMLAILDEARR